jgi:hypothetical protein
MSTLWTRALPGWLTGLLPMTASGISNCQPTVVSRPQSSPSRMLAPSEGDECASKTVALLPLATTQSRFRSRVTDARGTPKPCLTLHRGFTCHPPCCSLASNVDRLRFVPVVDGSSFGVRSLVLVLGLDFGLLTTDAWEDDRRRTGEEGVTLIEYKTMYSSPKTMN